MLDVRTVDLVLSMYPGSQLVTHRFSEKVIGIIRQKQAKAGKKAKEERNPEAEFLEARYLDAAGRECVPITAIKKALVSAGTAMDNLTKVALRQSLFVAPTHDPAADLCPIETTAGQPAVGVMREDAVTLAMNIRGLVYRPGYSDWRLRVTVHYNPRMVSKDQLLLLAEHAGWGVGIGEGRPEKTSALGWGRFLVQEAAA